MGGEHIEIDLNIIPSPRVFHFVHPDLIVVLRFCDLCVDGSASRETSMISRRIGWTGAGGLWGFKFLVLSMALLVVMGAGQKLAAADRPRPGAEKSKSEGRAGFIDRLLESSWKKAGVNPAKPATDEEYLRRAYLDLLGRIPDVQEARAFLQTRETDKREKLVDFLLGHADYPTNSFRPIDTSAPGVKICEHMPRMAKQMHHMNIIRSLDSKEGDHDRGTYLMHSGYAPNPTVVHPGWGSIAAYELGEQLKNFDLPHSVAINEPGMGAGFLGMSFSPFVIQNPNAPIANLKPPADVDAQRFDRRLDMLGQVENDFIAERRSQLAVDHKAVYGKTIRMMNSKYKDIFNLQSESAAVREGRRGHHRPAGRRHGSDRDHDQVHGDQHRHPIHDPAGPSDEGRRWRPADWRADRLRAGATTGRAGKPGSSL